MPVICKAYLFIPGVGNGTHSNILTWKFPWTEEPGGLQIVRHDGATEHTHLFTTLTFLPLLKMKTLKYLSAKYLVFLPYSQPNKITSH